MGDAKATERAAHGRRRWQGRPAATGALLVLLAVAARLPAYLSARHLHFDDGVYGISAIGMRRGDRPFEDLFSPQGPLHLVLVRLGDVIGLTTGSSPRLASVAAGALATVAAWRAGTRLGGTWGGTVAGVLVATTGTMVWTTGPITGDGIAVAFAVCAVWGAIRYRDEPSLGAAVATGIAMGAALSTKSLVITAALPVGWWLWSHRRVRDVAVAVAAAVAVGLAVTLPFGFSRVWDQSVSYHSDSEYLYGPVEQASKLASTLVDRDLLVLVAVALGLFAWWRTGGSAVRARDDVVITVWLAAAALFLVLEPAMFRNHIASVVAPLALIVAMHPPPPRWFVVAIVVVAPWWATHLSDLLVPGGYEGDEAEVVAAIRELPEGALVISDEPGFVWRAGRATVADLNDTSIKRIQQGRITTESVAAAAARDDVCAVVIWSNRFGRELPGLREALADRGYEEALRWPRDRSFWQKPDCPI